MVEKLPLKILIVGAGEAGIMVFNEICHHSEMNYEIVGFVDDNQEMQGKYIKNVKVLGTREHLPEIIKTKDVDEVLIAIPSAEGSVIRDTINLCQHSRTSFRIVPGLWEIINGNISINQIRQVNENDLLGRETVVVDKLDIEDYIKGKKVMVTGGGGSIGSELCRQIARHKPASLIIFSRGENSLYEIGVELNNNFPDLNVKLVVGNVEDLSKVDRSIQKNQPEIIFHAAAHKHVSFMENDPEEAIKTNVFGTKNLAESAIKWNVEKFVLVSTDKAVNPTSVMGASKRIAEMVIQHLSNVQNQTKFITVRFGNVIGSRGSVLPLFKRQIEFGGPVTVTHPKVVRYFMTIPEAVQLILQAVSIGKGGEVFVLDMGTPIKIVDLVKNLIVLSGFIPEKDIKIKFTGIRPGEKLYEEPLTKQENVTATKKDKIYVANLKKVNEEFVKKLDDLQQIISNYDADELICKLTEIVPPYMPNRERKLEYFKVFSE